VTEVITTPALPSKALNLNPGTTKKEKEKKAMRRS
jgi:hypothetical protein